MLEHLFDSLRASGLSAGEVLLLRALAAAAVAFVLAVPFGAWFIHFQLRNRVLERAEKGDSERLDDMHRDKTNTPTMGGVIFIVPTIAATLLFARLDNRFVWLLFATLLILGVVGFLDDLTKLRFAGRKGVSGRFKLLVQLGLGAGLGAYFYADPLVEGGAANSILLPFLEEGLPLGVASIALCALVVAGSSNAVNLTDGLDGLAMGCAVLVAIPLAVLGGVAVTANALVASSTVWPSVPVVAGSAEVTIFLSSLTGGGMGFLWYNCHPARVFMGDTGALPLGGVLGLAAVILKQELLFALAAGVFVIEALSVILQIGSFKLRGKRIFLIAPLHHHFQFRGWAETKVTVRFWIAAAVLGVISMASLKLG